MDADSIIQSMRSASGPVAQIRRGSSLVLDACELRDNTLSTGSTVPGNSLVGEPSIGAAIRIFEFNNEDIQATNAVMVRHMTLYSN